MKLLAWIPSSLRSTTSTGNMFIRQDGQSVGVLAPAKLNLFLEVLAKRPDGYHEIETVMVAINRFDALAFKPTDESRIILHISRSGEASRGLPKDSRDNLVYRALLLLQQRSDVRKGGVATLTKHIPPASGLGGGSSDAAAALLAANRAWNLRWPVEQLQSLAAELGSDIPFFLTPHQGNSATMAVCRGRGEIVEPTSAPANMHFVVARPQVGLSTPEVYKNCRPAKNPRSAGKLLQALRSGDRSESASLMTNRLQAAAAGIAPEVSEMARRFDACGAIAHQLSGSGSAYFGWFPNAFAARRAAARLRGNASNRAWYARAI